MFSLFFIYTKQESTYNSNNMKAQRLQITSLIGLIIILVILSFSGVLSLSINSLLNIGISRDIIYLVEILPFIGLTLAFFNIILGVNIPGHYIPIILIINTFILGLYLTLGLLLISLFIIYTAKFLIKSLHIHLTVKSSLIISIISLFSLLILPILAKTNIFNLYTGPFFIISIIIISIINEKFVDTQISFKNIKKDFGILIKYFIFITLNFLLLGGKFYYWTASTSFTELNLLKNILQSIPEINLLIIFMTFLIGRYTGLRITEIIRFRKLLFKQN